MLVSSDTVSMLENLRLLGHAIGAATCSCIITWSTVGQICRGMGNILVAILQLWLIGYKGGVSRWRLMPLRFVIWNCAVASWISFLIISYSGRNIITPKVSVSVELLVGARIKALTFQKAMRRLDICSNIGERYIYRWDYLLDLCTLGYLWEFAAFNRFLFRIGYLI